MCLVRRFWGDSAEQAKKCSTPSDQSVASGKRQTLLSELVRRSRKLTVPTSLDRSRIVCPARMGEVRRGAGRWSRKIVSCGLTSWCYGSILSVDLLVGDAKCFKNLKYRNCCRGNKPIQTGPSGDRKTLKKFEVN